jgi:hypothetical protein
MSLKAEFGRLVWSFKSEKKKQRLLDEACNLLRIWPETNALLDLAKQQGVGIRFDDALDGTDTDGYFHRNRQTGDCYIALKPCAKPEEIAIPLIHELRHLWQEQQLGLTPEKSALSEKDVQFALLLTRVKEADAFAFTNLMISRINHAQVDFKDAQELEKKLLKDSGAAQLSPAQQIQVDDLLANRMADRLPFEVKKMADDFLRELGTLDSYDRIAVSDYFRRYVSATGPNLPHLTAKDGHVTTLADVRSLMKAGSENMPPYLRDQDDARLIESILSGVSNDVRDTAALIDSFEKAAARGAPPSDLSRQQVNIGDRVIKLRHP